MAVLLHDIIASVKRFWNYLFLLLFWFVFHIRDRKVVVWNLFLETKISTHKYSLILSASSYSISLSKWINLNTEFES